MDKLTSVYGQPLARDLGLTTGRALELMRRAVLKKVREKLLQSTLSERAKKALVRSLRAQVSGSRLVLSSKHPAFRILIRGQRSGQMRWLLKAGTPIPIETDKGETIFREATQKSMTQGKWVHPGRDRQTFLEKAKKEARAELKAYAVREIRKTVLKAKGKVR